MKKLIRQPIHSGIQYDDGDYVIDYVQNHDNDIITIQPPQLYRKEFRNKIYWFGYEFNADVSSKQRTEFIHYIKGLGDRKISDADLIKLIELPLNELSKRINMYDIDCFAYPLSGRSDIVKKIVQTVGRYTSHDTSRCSFEFIKSAPTDIEFDWESFDADNKDDKNRYNQMRKYVEDNLLPAIKQLDYFSLAQAVKPKYRKYMTNYLNMSADDAARFSKLKGKTILVVDDINTSGATLDEILRKLGKINNNCNIYLYTLIGN